MTLTIGLMKPGISPESVLPTAVAAARELTTVEASDVAVVSGAAQLTVRFMADDGELARQLGVHVAAVTGGVAEVVAWKVTERDGGRWYLLR